MVDDNPTTAEPTRALICAADQHIVKVGGHHNTPLAGNNHTVRYVTTARAARQASTRSFSWLFCPFFMVSMYVFRLEGFWKIHDIPSSPFPQLFNIANRLSSRALMTATNFST
jgi:hypothetical protein